MTIVSLSLLQSAMCCKAQTLLVPKWCASFHCDVKFIHNLFSVSFREIVQFVARYKLKNSGFRIIISKSLQKLPCIFLGQLLNKEGWQIRPGLLQNELLVFFFLGLTEYITPCCLCERKVKRWISSHCLSYSFMRQLAKLSTEVQHFTFPKTTKDCGVAKMENDNNDK